MKKLVLIVAIVMAWTSASHAATSPYKICANKKTGAIAFRTSCKKTEKSVTNLNSLKGATGATGATGAAGANGSAKAYGFVAQSGAINAAKSTSNASATKIGTGEYCITATGLDSTTVFPILTADFSDGTGTHHIAQVVSNTTDCAAGNQWKVRTYNFNGTTFVSTDIAFSFVIP